MIKFAFKVKTRSGTVVDNLTFAARDRADAERKVEQIYQRCEILECRELQQTIREESFDLESAINLISKEPDPVPQAAPQTPAEAQAPADDAQAQADVKPPVKD